MWERKKEIEAEMVKVSATSANDSIGQIYVLFVSPGQ